MGDDVIEVDEVEHAMVDFVDLRTVGTSFIERRVGETSCDIDNHLAHIYACCVGLCISIQIYVEIDWMS